MIGFKISSASAFLDIEPKAAVSITQNSPLFARDSTPGLITYPLTVPATPRNQRMLGFPQDLASQAVGAIEWPAQFFIMGVLWKVGVIRYLGYNSKERSYTLNFKSDAGDFASLSRDQSLRSIPYPAQPLDLSSRPFPDANYALFPVKNAGFYGDKRPGFQGYQNYYHAGTFAGAQTVTPFLYVRFVLQSIMDHYGYNLAGAWLDEPTTKALCIYSNHEHQGGPTVNAAAQLPDIRVGEFLQALRNQFGLAYLFDANSKTLTIARLKDIIADVSYLEWTGKAERDYTAPELETAGFTLRQALESDELNKTLSTDPAQLKVAGGREEIATAAGFFHMSRETDTATGKTWLVPATHQPGTSAAWETGENKPILRFLQYQGLQTDSQNGQYPLGSQLNENYHGAPLNGRSLRWAGPDGLYANNWAAWLDFLAQAKPVERNVRVNIGDLVTLDPTRKLMIDHLKYYYESLSFSVSNKDGIGKVKGKFVKVLV